MSKLRATSLVLLLIFSTFALMVPVTAEGPATGDDGSRVATTGRVVLAELVTAGWCGNCPSADGALELMQETYSRSELAILAYHRVDDLSFDDGDTRMAFYGSPNQPDVFFDGVIEVVGNKGSVTANLAAYEVAYDERAAVDPALAITVEGWTDTTTGQGQVWVNVTADATPTLGDLRLHAVVFEDDFGPWNGGNGVLQHHWTAREMLAGPDGTAITISSGETRSFAFTYDATAYAQDLDEIGVVAFVQSAGTSREVLQTGYMKEFKASSVNGVPELSHASVTPETGNTSTTFRYEVQYMDPDNDRPVSSKLFVGGLSYTMQTDSSGPWDEWVTFYHETALTVGDDHTYSFSFSDGNDQVLLPDPASGPSDFDGPVVEPPSSAPTLTLASIQPAEGDALTLRTFSVVYTDGEGDAPSIAQIVIDGVAYNMTGDGTDYRQGVTFTYSTLLSVGDHEFHIIFGDGRHGARLPAQGENVESVTPELQRIVVLASHAEDGEVVLGEEVRLGFLPDGVPVRAVTSYLWESDVDGILGNEAEVTFTPSLGPHRITMTVETEDGTHKDWIEIVVWEAIAEAVVSDVMFSPAEPMEGDVVRFTVTVGNDGTIDAEDVLVRLLDASGELLTFAELTTPIGPGETTTVTLEWEPGEGAHVLTVEVAASTEQVSILVKENSPPLATISVVGLDEGDKAEFSVGERIHFVGLASDPEGEAVTYEWNFGDGGTSDEVEPEHEYGREGTYEVTVTVTDPRGASTTSTFELEVMDTATPDVGPFTVVMVLLISALVMAVVRRRR